MNKPSNNQSTSSSRLIDLLVVFILVLVFALILEQTIRFYLFGAESFSYNKMKSVGSMGYTGYLQKSDYPDVVYEFKPKIDSYFKLADFRTNSQGFRDKEYSLEKPEKTFRVAVIGGSFTVPAGVEIDEAFHSLLEERFKKENPGSNYEFINFGVSGYRINNKMATLKHKALKYNPDLILFILDGSQFTEEEEEEEFNPKPQKNQFFQSFTYKLISKNKLFKNNNEKEFLDEHKRGLDEFNLKLQELSNISQKNNVPIYIVVLDHDYSHYQLSADIKQLVENNNLYYVNTIPSFQDLDISELIIYKTDIHPNSKANKIFANAIYGELKKQPLLDNK